MTEELVLVGSEKFENYISKIKGFNDRFVRLKEKLEKSNPDITTFDSKVFESIGEKDPDVVSHLKFWLKKYFNEINLSDEDKKKELSSINPLEILARIVKLHITKETKTQVKYMITILCVEESKWLLEFYANPNSKGDSIEFFESLLDCYEAILTKLQR